MARWRTAAGITTVAVLAIAAVFLLTRTLRGEPEQTAPAPAAAAPSPTPTPTSHPDPMPELHNTGDDFDQIYRSIEDFRNWLFRNPDPNLADRIYHSACECLEETRRRLQILAERRFRFGSNKTVIHEITVLDADNAATAVKVVKQQLRQVVVDAQGQIVDEDPESDVEAYRFLLVRENGAWLVRDIAEVPQDLEVSVPSETI